MVINENDVIIATHSQVFGPTSKEVCEKWVIDNCGKETVPQFIVAALSASLPAKNEQCLVVKEGDVIIATHSQVFGPAIEDECKKWVDENCGKEPAAPIC